jgi:hypothetical protein
VTCFHETPRVYFDKFASFSWTDTSKLILRVFDTGATATFYFQPRSCFLVYFGIFSWLSVDSTSQANFIVE